MEQVFQFSMVVTLLLFIILVVKLCKKPQTAKSTTQNLPPGPWKLPLIGSMHHLIGSQPHHRLRDLAKNYGPLMHLQLGEVCNIIVSSPEAAREVMKTHDVNFANRPHFLAAKIITYNCTDIAFSPYGDYWRQLRKICTLEMLTAKRVQSFRSIREEEVSKLVRSISCSAGSVVNLSEMLSSLTYGITSRAAFGKRFDGERAFVAAVKEILELSGGFTLADLFPSSKLLHMISGLRPKLERVHKEVDGILERIIQEHRARRAEAQTGSRAEEDDLVDVLLNLQDHGDLEVPLTTNNIKAVIVDMFIAGIDSSTRVAEWAMSEMVKHPRVMEMAQAEVRKVFGEEGIVDEARFQELNYLKLVIKETLRLHPTSPLLLPRECREKCQINGYDIPVNTKVIVNAWAIGRDPNNWTEAERFYPERFIDSSVDYKGTNYEFVPFGAGRRMCPGMLYGIANIELPLAQLLYHFNWKLPFGINPESLDMTEAFGSIVKRKNELCLIPATYLPQPVN